MRNRRLWFLLLMGALVAILALVTFGCGGGEEKKNVLKDFNVRLALSRAIDRNALVKVVYNDAYIPADYWLVEGIPGYQGNGPFESIIGYDPTAAKKALADAGYPDGKGFPTLKITSLDRPDRKAEAEFLQKSWKETLGINVEIEAVDAKTRSGTFNSKQFELYMGGWQIDYPDPENPLIGLFDTGGGNNMYECSDPDIDAKLKAASTETDNDARIKLLQEAETLVVTRLCGAAPVYQTAMPYLVNSKIGGVKANGLIDAAMPGNWCPECWFVKEGGPGATTGAGGAAPADQQKIVVQSGEPEFFDPHRSNFEQDIAVERMLFRGLYELVITDSGGVEAVPAMAADEPTVNGSVYTVKLKSGLKWSDGQPLTAKDFEYGMKRECSPEVAGPYQYLLGETILNIVGCDDYFLSVENGKTAEEQAALRDAVGVKAVDDTTVEITLAAPKTTFTTIMSLWATFPARQDIIEKYGDKWTDPGNIVVNGPFTLTEFVAKDHVTLKPNPNWALDPKPQLQQLTVKFIDDTEVAFRAFQTGELDITLIPAAEIPTVNGNDTLKSQYLLVGAGRIWAVEMQLGKAQ